MNPYYQYGHNSPNFTNYHSPLSHPPYWGAHVEVPYFPTMNGNTAMYPSSTDCENHAATPRTPQLSRRVEQRKRQKKKKREAIISEQQALTNCLTNQLPVDVRPQERAVLPNVTITSTTSSVTIETALSSASKVLKQTLVDASVMANMSGEHSQSTNDKGPRNQVNAQRPSVETPLPMTCTGPDMQDESTVSTRHGGTSTLSMAIRRSDCLGTEFNPGDIEKIQMGLHKMIDEHSNDNFSPHFEDYSVQTDALIVHCANRATVNWLKVVFDNNEVFAGLRLVRACVLPKVRVAFKTKDILTSDPVVFLKRLQRQNTNLHTGHWMTKGSPTMELGLQTQQLFHQWIFKIDQGSANVIKATNMTAYTGLSKGTFEFLPDVEPPKEIVIKQEAEPSSS